MGEGLNCFEVRDASSRAKRRPSTETIRAASFNKGGIDITGVFRGIMLDVSTSPARILPQARRLIGLMTAGLFSLIGENELNRG